MSGSDRLSFTVHENGDITIVAIKGELDLATSSQLEVELTVLLNEGHKRLVVDLGEVPFIDSTGIKALLTAHQRVEGEKGDFRLAAPQPTVVKVIRLTALDQLLHLDDTVQDAIEALDVASGPVVAADSKEPVPTAPTEPALP